MHVDLLAMKIYEHAVFVDLRLWSICARADALIGAASPMPLATVALVVAEDQMQSPVTYAASHYATRRYATTRTSSVVDRSTAQDYCSACRLAIIQHSGLDLHKTRGLFEKTRIVHVRHVQEFA